MPVLLNAGEVPIAGYTLVRSLGRGGFGEVWEAMAPGGVRVALKFIRLDAKYAGPEQRALEAIRDIRHPHLLDVQFAVRMEDFLVIAMPLCDRSLKDRLEECLAGRRLGVPIDELMGYMSELAEAVDYLNEPCHPSGDGRLVGVQHRDIKPHNVFLVGGSARLADFGLAKVLEETLAEHSGGVSPQYAAPEVIQGQVSQQTDQYSLAVTYLQLRTGRLPFEGGSAHRYLYAHVNEVPDLSGLPAAERPAVARALAKRPDDRWPDCRSFVRAIQSQAPVDLEGETTETSDDGEGRTTIRPLTTLPEPPRVEPVTPRKLSRRTLAIGGAATLAGLAVAIGLALRPASTTAVPKIIEAVEVTSPPKAAESGEGAPPTAAIVLASDSASDPKLAERAHATLKTYCYRCHGVRFEVPGYNVLDRDILVAKRAEGEKPYIKPGDLEGSETWLRVGVEKDMPPSGPKPSADERKLIGDWIKAGAPFPVVAVAARSVRTEKDVLTAVRDHLRNARETDRPHLRYFTLHNLYNNRTTVDADLRVARAAVSKLVNSLSRKADVVVPKAIDPDQVVLAIDQRDLGWDRRDLWKEILASYPYGLKHDKDANQATRSLASEVEQLSGTAVPHVRADWFVANASRPPLYHSILDLPRQAAELKRQLDVDTEADFLNDKLARAGFAESGVSGENRVVDRHEARHGAYWESYDFRKSDGPGNIFQRPIGPSFAANPFPRQSFEHAGGEIIFSLANGMQGYLLVDAKGERIDVGPSDIVSDSLKSAGTAEVVNGISCIGCHQDGMRRFKDTVRAGMGISGSARDKAERLYREPAEMAALLDKDEARFLKAVEQAEAGFLKVGDDAGKSIRDFPEPIGAVARFYSKDLGPEEVAAELGLKGVEELAGVLRANAALRRLGLGPLIQGGAIKRSQWDSLADRLISTFQDAARELELGTPFRVF